MLEKNEKVYLIILVISTIVLIFSALYFTNNCPKCDETYAATKATPVVVYKIG